MTAVDSLGDGAPNAANCAPAHAAGACRLRDAIAAAPVSNTITFSISGQITLTNGTLTLAKSVTIDATGHAIVVDGGCVGCDPPGNTPSGGVTVFGIDVGVVAALTGLTI
ncbi:MAG: hypothetical protein ACR2JW_12720 [Thermomicrobiales bacterium]